MWKSNIVTLTDSYKMTHDRMYPKGTENVFSYFEARKGAEFDETTFFGLQYLIKAHLEGQVVTTEKIDKAEKLAARHFGNTTSFNREKWDYIVEKHDGFLPIEIRAVEEGLSVPINNIMMSVEATDDKCFWLTNHVETLLCQVWAPSTVATLSKHTKKMYREYLEQSCDDGANFPGLDFMLHDFGMRGVSSMESAGIEGAGHLINFLGTDTVIAMEFIEEYYLGTLIGNSVNATEHSIMTAQARGGERAVIQHLLNEFPTGILSVVCDSYNWKVTVREMFGKEFKEQILERDGKFVVRPDSGDPVEVTLELINILCEEFGYTVNKKGFIVLNPKVGLIWGDGIDYHGIEKVLKALVGAGYSAENMVFGMGGGLLQKINRDTQCFAFKSSAQKRLGEWFDVYKDPIDGSKSSKRGRLGLYLNEQNEFETLRIEDAKGRENLLHVVLSNGDLVRELSFDLVRDNSLL